MLPIFTLLFATLGPAHARTWVVGRDAADVTGTIALAAAGDVVHVPAGVWVGSVVVDRSIQLVGEEGAIIDGEDEGTVVRLAAPGAQIIDLGVRGSGKDRSNPDACVYIEPEAVDAVVAGSTLSDCTFGIWVHKGLRTRIENNSVRGHTDISHRSNRGNAIHLFDSRELIVRGNTATGTRDGIFVSATHDSIIEANEATSLRYCIHYMYSFDNTIRANICTGNASGIALMESRGLIVEDNICRDNEQRGILFRDVQYTRVANNIVEGNQEGLFFFSSLDNVIVNNRIAHNDTGARVWAGTERNVVSGNDFIANRQQIYYVARDDQSWGDEDGGNYWSDHLGWDQDGDGLGDRPYQVDSFMSTLLYQYPSAALLMNSPTLELLARMQSLMPALRVPTVIDPKPRMEPH